MISSLKIVKSVLLNKTLQYVEMAKKMLSDKVLLYLLQFRRQQRRKSQRLKVARLLTQARNQSKVAVMYWNSPWVLTQAENDQRWNIFDQICFGDKKSSHGS